MDDETIVALYWARSEVALSETQRKYGTYCHYIARCILHSDEDAEECVNDTYNHAWHSIPPARPHNLRCFVGSITRHLALHRLDYLSAQKRHCDIVLSLDEYAECLPDPNADPADAQALRDSINRFLAALPRETRIIFLRRYWYHTPVREIAGALGRSEGSVKVILHRTRLRFKEHLEKEALL